MRHVQPTRLGTITEIRKGIAIVELDGGGTARVHPSAWRDGHTDETAPRVGDRVHVLGSDPTEAAWRA